MTAIAIQEQRDAIKSVTNKALKSKATTRQFLVDAGIIKDEKAEQIKRLAAMIDRKVSFARVIREK